MTYLRLQVVMTLYVPASTGSDDLPASTGRRLQVLLQFTQHDEFVILEFVIFQLNYKVTMCQKKNFQNFLLIDPLDVSI